MDSTSQTLDVEKPMIQKLEENKIQLQEKIKELEANEEDMQKLLAGYECEKAGANQANAAMVEMAKKLTLVVTKLKKCLEIHKEFIEKLMVKLEEKKVQLEEKKQANELSTTIMDSTSKTSADDATKLNSDLFELVEKLTIQLNEKDKEVTEYKQQIKEFRQTIAAYQTTFWKIFPTYDYYYIKAPLSPNGQFNNYLYVYADVYAQLHCSTGDEPVPCASKFTFEKKQDGSFTIYSSSQERYMHTARLISAQPVTFWPNHDPDGTFCSPTKFVLFYHQQIQQPGIVVDIRSLANDCFLSVDNQNRVVANSRTPPANKFLIIPADEQ